MKRLNMALAAATVLVLTSITLEAQGKGGGSANKPPKQNTAQTVKPQTPKAAPATKTAPATQAKALKGTQTTKTTQPTQTTKANAKSSTKSTKTSKAATTSNTGTNTTSNTDTTGSTPAPSNTVTLSAVQQKLNKNTNLASKLQSRLPAGTDLMKAADGFRNLGQFVAAVNVSKNLDIPFAKLKTEMVKENLSLGQAIQKLKPTVSGTVEAQRAEYDARGMIQETETQNASTAATTSSKKPSKNTSGGGSDE